MKRAYESLLFELLEAFPCVAIVGPRQCGKTTQLQSLPKSWKRIDLERAADFEVAARDPDLFLRLNSNHVAIDECQRLPQLFQALRVAIDERRDERGRFVITGSSSPDLLSSISESLAGRIAVIEMAPFAWSEIRTHSDPTLVDFLCDRHVGAVDIAGALSPRGELGDVHDYWFWGGYPEPLLAERERFRRLWMEQYVRSYLERDIALLFPGLNRDRFRLFLRLLGGLSGKVLNYSEVSRSLGVSQPTVRDYFEIAHGTFVWRRLSPFERNATKRIVKHPKGFLRDSGLLHHLQRIPDIQALLTHPQMGSSWEGMVIEELIRQLNACGIGFDPFYYRTSAGAEIDLVLDGDFGLIPIEIKYTSTVSPRSLRSLRDFVRERGCRMGLVINNDTEPRLYDENIVGVPFAWL